MEKEGVEITQENYPEIYKWLSENVHYYKNNQKHFTLTSEGKINAYCDVIFFPHIIKKIKYPFGYVCGSFVCNNCKFLTSFLGSPERIDGFFDCTGCNSLVSILGFPKYTNGSVYIVGIYNYKNKEYKNSYIRKIDMWFELLDSVSGNERVEYINNYKDKTDAFYNRPIIPKEVMNKYKIDFLLNEK